MTQNEAAIIDATALSAGSESSTIAWGFSGSQLNVNLMVWRQGEGSPDHVNNEREVLIVGIEGKGTVTVDGSNYELSAGKLIIIPIGAKRKIVANSDRFSYLTTHKRNPPLWPEGVPRTLAE